MELDRQTAALLERLQEQLRAAAGQVEGSDVEAARAATRGMFLTLAGKPDAAAQVEALSIEAAGRTIPARLYRPQATGRYPLPLIVFLHGGGWCLGDLDSYDAFARSMCGRSGALFLSVDYRLAPEHKFPAGLEDALAATQWAAAHAAQLDADATRLAVMGDSAGGNLAAVAAHRLGSGKDLQLAAQFLLYPVLDVSRPHADYPSRELFGGGEYLLTRGSIDATTAWYLDDMDRTDDPAVSPLLRDDLSGLPPAVIVTAGHDPLRDEGKQYADRLTAAGVPVAYRCFEATIHAFLSFGILDVAQQARAWLAQEIRRHLAAD